eukprot:7094117-Pyramimonas_sp.AAC.1
MAALSSRVATSRASSATPRSQRLWPSSPRPASWSPSRPDSPPGKFQSSVPASPVLDAQCPSPHAVVPPRLS